MSPDAKPVRPKHRARGRLMVSQRATRKRARRLGGARLRGRVAIFLRTRGARKVHFRLDGRRVQTEKRPPFDLGGGDRQRARRLNTRRLRNGRHRVVARVTRKRGRTFEVRAVFKVRNHGRKRSAR